MSLIDDITVGRYCPGNSLIHRLDPRIKLSAMPLLVIASFAFHDITRLAVVGALAAGLTFAGRLPWRLLFRGIMSLRWLLAATVLLHLLFSPGHTLFGIAWLSRDGLLQGGLVCMQLVLALWFSSLLTLTTKPRDLARACGSLFSPLERFGFPARDTALFFMLVLHFIPILREEIAALKRRDRKSHVADSGFLTERLRGAGEMMSELVFRVVERTDRIARETASGENEICDAAALEPFPPVSPREIAGVTAGLLGMLIFIGLLP